MKNFNFILICSLTLSFLLTGCMPDSLTKFKKDPPIAKVASSTTKTEPTDPTDPPDLTTLGSFQLRNITQNDTSYHLHKYGQNNEETACAIPIGDLEDGDEQLVDGSSDILCWMEAEEIQLYFNGADLQVNAPASQCEYIQVKPYYYWNAQPVNTQKKLREVTCALPTDGNCAAQGNANVLTAEELTCSGDYSSIGGPNCDEGYIETHSVSISAFTPEIPATATASSTPAVPSVVSETVITKKACGGKRTNCYGGPGVDFKLSKNGFPMPVNYLAFTGQSINYSITAPGPLGKGFDSNHYLSNFTQIFAGALHVYDYTVNEFPKSTSGFEVFSRTSSTFALDYDDSKVLGPNATSTPSTNDALVDIARDPLKRADARLQKTGPESWLTRSNPITYPVQAFYEFSCLNYAQEVKGRIRLQIRDWNKKFQTPVTDEVSHSAPVNLVEHSQDFDDFETSGVGYWNDVESWDYPFPYIYTVNGEGRPITGNPADYGFLFPQSGFTPTN